MLGVFRASASTRETGLSYGDMIRLAIPSPVTDSSVVVDASVEWRLAAGTSVAAEKDAARGLRRGRSGIWRAASSMALLCFCPITAAEIQMGLEFGNADISCSVRVLCRC